MLAFSAAALSAALLPAVAGTAAPAAVSVVPFALMLLAVALLPRLAPALWHAPARRALVVAALAGPTAIAQLGASPAGLAAALHEYASFVILIGSLYVVAGGIYVHGGLGGSAGRNAACLAVGAALASVVGTTGAAMLLIRPLLRANAGRARQAHVLVAFIVVVGNVGGLLTPLGDPPLFLGYLRGVPFTWTLQLWPVWAAASAYLIGLCYVVDRRVPAAPGRGRPRVEGVGQLALLAAIVALVAAGGVWDLPPGAAEAGMLVAAAVSLATTPPARRRHNGFSWAPVVEVATVFAGIFVTMAPALALMADRAPSLGLAAPRALFWLTGLLSAVLDNAPTYLTLTAAASSLSGTDPAHLGELVATPAGEARLVAIALGAVIMGALTYLGNGPNLMVRAVAEEAGVTMPGFVAYAGAAALALAPVLAALTLWLPG